MSKYCSICGNKIEEDNTFCGNCGSQVNYKKTITISNNSVKNKNNSMAITGFICSLVNIIFGAFFLPGILGLVFSAVGLKQIKETGEGGKGLALTGLIISIITVTCYFLFFIFIFGLAACVSTLAY